jgi:hypothetical protein
MPTISAAGKMKARPAPISPFHPIGRTHHIQKVLLVDPAPAGDHFVMQHRDMRGGSAKGGETETGSQTHHFANAALGLLVH